MHHHQQQQQQQQRNPSVSYNPQTPHHLFLPESHTHYNIPMMEGWGNERRRANIGFAGLFAKRYGQKKNAGQISL